jgi:hypothetical protein
VVSPVKHCRHPGFLATRRMPLLPLLAATASLSSGIFAETIQDDQLPRIIDGQDIICQ